MKRISALASLITLSSFFWGGFEEPALAQASCQATVDAVAREMRKKGTSVGVRVLKGTVEAVSIDNSRRTNSVVFDLDAGLQNDRATFVAINIVESVLLMKSYSNRIFDNCSGTGYVSFLKNDTLQPWGGTFGMTDDSTLGYYQCSNLKHKLANTISSIYTITYSSYDHEYCAYVIPDF
jgi:hypothetical protein